MGKGRGGHRDTGTGMRRKSGESGAHHTLSALCPFPCTLSAATRFDVVVPSCYTKPHCWQCRAEPYWHERTFAW